MKVYRFGYWGTRELEAREALRVTDHFAVFAGECGRKEVRESLTGPYGWFTSLEACIAARLAKLKAAVAGAHIALERSNVELAAFRAKYGAE